MMYDFYYDSDPFPVRFLLSSSNIQSVGLLEVEINGKKIKYDFCIEHVNKPTDPIHPKFKFIGTTDNKNVFINGIQIKNPWR